MPAGLVAIRLFDTDGTERLVGVRASTPDVSEVLAQRLEPLTVSDIEVTPNLSLKVGEQEGARRGVHSVHRNGHRTFMTFDLDEAIEATIETVHTLAEPPPGIVALHGRALVRDGRAIIVTDVYHETLDAERRRLAAAGFERPRHCPLWVDPASAELLLPNGDPLHPEFTRVPIGTIVSISMDMVDHQTRAGRISYVLSLVAGRMYDRYSTRRDIDGLLELMTHVPLTLLRTHDRREVVKALCAL